MADERRPTRHLPADQRSMTNEEFRRRLEHETDVSLRDDPQRRRFSQTADLPHSRSSSHDQSPAAMPHRGEDALTWNDETLTVIQWSQRTGIRVETLLRRCRRGWSVQRILTELPGGGTVATPPV